MKCPKCNSERIQFGTNTKGSSFSDGDACCGLILMGPIGLLCGFCGNETTTEEFWICQDCGNKFTNEEGIKQQQYENEKRERYLNAKKIKEDALLEYGTIEKINELYNKAKETLAKADEDYDLEYNKFIDENIDSNESIKKIYKKDKKRKMGIGCGFSIVLGILAILGAAIGLWVFALICGVISIALVLIRGHKEDIIESEIVTDFVESSPLAERLYYEYHEAKENFEKLESIVDAIRTCDVYEVEQGLYRLANNED